MLSCKHCLIDHPPSPATETVTTIHLTRQGLQRSDLKRPWMETTVSLDHKPRVFKHLAKLVEAQKVLVPPIGSQADSGAQRYQPQPMAIRRCKHHYPTWSKKPLNFPYSTFRFLKMLKRFTGNDEIKAT